MEKNHEFNQITNLLNWTDSPKCALTLHYSHLNLHTFSFDFALSEDVKIIYCIILIKKTTRDGKKKKKNEQPMSEKKSPLRGLHVIVGGDDRGRVSGRVVCSWERHR